MVVLQSQVQHNSQLFSVQMIAEQQISKNYYYQQLFDICFAEHTSHTGDLSVGYLFSNQDMKRFIHYRRTEIPRRWQRSKIILTTNNIAFINKIFGKLRLSFCEGRVYVAINHTEKINCRFTKKLPDYTDNVQPNLTRYIQMQVQSTVFEKNAKFLSINVLLCIYETR